MASGDLPIEVVDLILSRLPAKSLLRFRCVRKSWRDLISSPQFIKRFQDDKLHEHVLIQDNIGYSLHRVIGLHGIMVTQTRIQLPYEVVQTHGYSNGLVCFSTFFNGFNIHLWNPSIRKFKLVPQPILTMGNHTILAFCFVPRINTYRLLSMPWFEYLDGKSEIYSLHTNSWKLIENTPLYDTIISTSCDANGVVYFLALLDEIIITFDMADEVFRSISISDVVGYGYDLEQRSLYPVIFGASLFIIHTLDLDGHIDEDEVNYMDWTDVWERKVHDDGTESWDITRTIDDLFEPVGFLKNGEMVCKHGFSDYHITSFDPRISEKLKRLPFSRISRDPYLVTYFVETLMFLDDPK